MLYFFKICLLGFRSFINGFKFIVEHKLYWYTIFPAILMLVIYQMGYLIKINKPETHAENMNQIVWYMLRLLIEIIIASALMRFAKYVVVIILSPLLSKLSQKTEQKINGKTYSFNMQQLWHDIQRGARIAVRNITWEIVLFSFAFLIGFIGWGDISNSPIRYLMYFISFYYYGFSFMDYTSERWKLNFEESIQFTRKNRGLAIVIGAFYSIMIWTFIDLKNLYIFGQEGTTFFEAVFLFVKTLFLWLCASFAPIWAIVSSTLALLELKKNSE